MEIDVAVAGLSALAHEGRLRAFRLLVQAGVMGLAAGGYALEHDVFEGASGSVIGRFGIVGGSVGGFDPLGELGHLSEKGLLFVALSLADLLAKCVLLGTKRLKLCECRAPSDIGGQGCVNEVGG